jgi:hypothetical protein
VRWIAPPPCSQGIPKAVRAIYRQKLTALDDLKKSLLHQAFTGQL